jgi:hypothetical protein
LGDPPLGSKPTRLCRVAARQVVTQQQGQRTAYLCSGFVLGVNAIVVEVGVRRMNTVLDD